MRPRLSFVSRAAADRAAIQANMKVITAIYLHCRPDLRDEWLAGIDVDADVEESLVRLVPQLRPFWVLTATAPQPHEQALRSLVRFFNTKHYSKHAPGLHRRSSSIPENANDPSPDFNPGPVASVPLPPLSPHGPPPDPSALDDVFPPPRALSSIDVGATVPLQLAYGAIDPNDDLSGYEVDDLLAAGGDPSHGSRSVEDASTGTAYAPSGGVVSSLGTSTPIAPSSQPSAGPAIQVDHDDLLDWLNDPLGASDAAWERLGLEGYEGEWDDVSDSESVGGWGFMRFGLDEPGATGTLADDGSEVLNQQAMRHEWEHISSVCVPLSVVLVPIVQLTSASCPSRSVPRRSRLSRKSAPLPASRTRPARRAAVRVLGRSRPPSDPSSSTGTTTAPADRPTAARCRKATRRDRCQPCRTRVLPSTRSSSSSIGDDVVAPQFDEQLYAHPLDELTVRHGSEPPES